QGSYPGAAEEAERGGRAVKLPLAVALEWQGEAGAPCRGEAHTRIVGPYGCLIVLPHKLELEQHIVLTNLVTRQSNPAIVVWKGNERAEGWELGIELIDPKMDVWVLEL